MSATVIEQDRQRPAHRAEPASSRARQLLRHAANPTLVFGIVAPFAVYELLHGRTSEVTALAVGAVFPAAATLWTLVRTRRPDPIALLTLGGIVLGLVGTRRSGCRDGRRASPLASLSIVFD